LFQHHYFIYQQVNRYAANEAETRLKLFQAVSMFCFSFISESATGFSFCCDGDG